MKVYLDCLSLFVRGYMVASFPWSSTCRPLEVKIIKNPAKERSCHGGD